jgi:hypothetical protein
MVTFHGAGRSCPGFPRERDRPLSGCEFGNLEICSGSAAPVRALDEQSFGCHVTPTGVKSRRPAASEISSRNADAPAIAAFKVERSIGLKTAEDGNGSKAPVGIVRQQTSGVRRPALEIRRL